MCPAPGRHHPDLRFAPGRRVHQSLAGAAMRCCGSRSRTGSLTDGPPCDDGTSVDQSVRHVIPTAETWFA